MIYIVKDALPRLRNVLEDAEADKRIEIEKLKATLEMSDPRKLKRHVLEFNDMFTARLRNFYQVFILFYFFNFIYFFFLIFIIFFFLCFYCL